jgi:uncharacterized membrane protein
MQTILRGSGIEVNPLHMALWGLPTAASAFIIHAFRLSRLDMEIERELGAQRITDSITDPLADTAIKGDIA